MIFQQNCSAMKLSTISSITRTDIHVLGKIPKVFRKNDQRNIQTMKYNCKKAELQC